MKPVRQFVPPSWKRFFQRWPREPQAARALCTSDPEDVKKSSPWLECPPTTVFHGEGSTKTSPPSTTTNLSKSEKMLPAAGSEGPSTGPPSYKEKLEAYDRKYAYMKSWPGLLRLLGGLELILGAMVFACCAAYTQKDYQWSPLYGGNLVSSSGYNYYGPMTPFVLVVASLAWLVTVVLLGLGVTMYYRTILLDSHWWPLTEFGLNLVLCLLYLAAALAYVNDVNRGGLCYSVFANNSPLAAALCRIEGAQVAAIAFLFITMLLYLAGSLVCLRMWQHEASRKYARTLRPVLLQAMAGVARAPVKSRLSGKASRHVEFSEEGEEDLAGTLNYAIPTGHMPKPHVVPDYVIKYPAIGSREERENYKAVFNDQHAEYKELYAEVCPAVQKCQELGSKLSKLPRRYQNKKDESRASSIWREYGSKKKVKGLSRGKGWLMDPTFLEKQERCDYLKKKLTHIKAQIQAYDQETSRGSMYF